VAQTRVIRECHKILGSGVIYVDCAQTFLLGATMTTGGDRISDHHLLAALQRGEESAYETLFLRHYGTVYGVVYGLTGSREAAEDIAQDTFLTLYHDAPLLDYDRNLVAWLCRVALNKSHNSIRSEQRATSREERAARMDVPASNDDPETRLLRTEEQARVRDALAQLPERQGKLLLLRNAGLSYAEVADLLNIAPTSVGTMLARAERSFMDAYKQVETNSLARAQALRLQMERTK
jgi:RNA polymerase sigma-70 factor (ECF subfamily)